jgi:hypothetical protein
MITSKNLPLWKCIPLMVVLWFASMVTLAQAPQPMYARLVFQKVKRDNVPEYEKMMKENIKPIHQLRKQNGKITNWRLFKIHFAGDEDRYNYVAISYYDSWAKTEPNDNWPELFKSANPKQDATLARFNSLLTVAKEAVYYREDFAITKTPGIFKYIVVDFMKVKGDQFDTYVNAEKTEWKPVHQALIDDNKRMGWIFWSLVVPFGSQCGCEYVTFNGFSSYEQIMSGSYADAFKKVHPGKEMQAVFSETLKVREQVHSEVWEQIEYLP